MLKIALFAIALLTACAESHVRPPAPSDAGACAEALARDREAGLALSGAPAVHCWGAP